MIDAPLLLVIESPSFILYERPLPDKMPSSIVDARGREFARRGYECIVSLVPSWTESIFALGAGERVVAVTDYCVEPRAVVANLPRIGGTKNPRIGEIISLQPDLVIANVEENRRCDIEQLEKAGIDVFITFARTVRQGIEELSKLGELLGARDAGDVIGALEQQYREIVLGLRGKDRPRVFVAIWKEPWMTANGDTFIGDMIETCGGANVFRERERRFPLAADLGSADPREVIGERDRRYPRVSMQEIVNAAPEVILLPDEPYAFCEEDAQTWRNCDIPAARTGDIFLLDGKMLSWYGVRIGANLKRLRELLHGDTKASD